MASSGSNAQAIKLCELCQENNTKWRCIDCVICLCGICKTSHQRESATAQHHILSIKTPLQDVPRKIVTDNMPCKNHFIQMACVFCRSCGYLICTECESTSHKNHKFESIEFMIDEKLDYLRGIYEDVDDKIKYCEYKTLVIENIRCKNHAILDESVTKIKEKEQELIKAITIYSKSLQKQIEKERLLMDSIFSKIGIYVDARKNTLENQRDEIGAVLASNQGTIIYESTVKVKDVKFDSLPNKMALFTPENTQNIQKSFGSISRKSTATMIAADVFPKMKFEVDRRYTTDMPYIETLVTLDKTSAWISCQSKEVIKKVNMEDNITTTQEVTMKVVDMAATKQNDILLCLYGDSEVKLLRRSGEITSFLTVEPLLPNSIHVTKNNEVIVGVVERGTLFQITDQSRRAVVVFGIDGNRKREYELDTYGLRLFTVPRKVTTSINEDIIVVDDKSDDTGHVVAISRLGYLRWIYEGHPQINIARKFDPRDMVTTAVGHILITDFASQMLHVVSEDGGVLTYLETKDLGIIWPWGLDIDRKGRLCIGCDTGDKETGAKLFILKFTF